MFSFILIHQVKSSVADEFSNTMPCDCDLTDKCDPYCCCDKDCNSSTISSFKEHFCIPQSPVSTMKITCDTNNRISNSKYVDSFIVNDKIKCYYVEKNLGEKDKIKNYDAQELGLENFEDYLPTSNLPGENASNSTDYPPLKGVNGYTAFGIGSRSCNSLYLVREGVEYDSECYMNPELILSGSIYNFAKVFPSYSFDSSSQAVSGNGKKVTITTDAITKEVTISNTPISGRGKASFKYTGMSDPDVVPTDGSGYISGLDIVSVIDTDKVPRYIYLEFSGQRVPFQGNLKQLITVGTEVNSDDLFKKHDYIGREMDVGTGVYPNVFPSFANFPLGLTSRYFNYKIPSFTISSTDDAKHVIYTFLYKKFGYKTAFYYKFVGVNMDIVNESSMLYHTIEIKQVEVNDDGTSTFQRESNELYTISLSSISDFMFASIKDVTKTAAVIALVILIVLIWMDSLFHQ